MGAVCDFTITHLSIQMLFEHAWLAIVLFNLIFEPLIRSVWEKDVSILDRVKKLVYWVYLSRKVISPSRHSLYIHKYVGVSRKLFYSESLLPFDLLRMSGSPRLLTFCYYQWLLYSCSIWIGLYASVASGFHSCLIGGSEWLPDIVHHHLLFVVLWGSQIALALSQQLYIVWEGGRNSD